MKNAGANDLAGNGGEDFVLARALVLRFLQCGLQKHLTQQIWVVEVLRIALKECDRRQFRLLDVQIFRLLKLKQWTDVLSLRRVNDDDTLALLELADEMVAVQRGQHRDGDRDEEPEPRQTITDQTGNQLANGVDYVSLLDVGVPVLNGIGNRNVKDGSLLSIQATATDPDNSGTLIYSLAAGSPTGASITADGLFTWTPTQAQAGQSYQIKISSA